MIGMISVFYTNIQWSKIFPRPDHISLVFFCFFFVFYQLQGFSNLGYLVGYFMCGQYFFEVGRGPVSKNKR